MKKKVFYLSLMLVAALMVSSCKKDELKDDDPKKEEGKSDNPDKQSTIYTVTFDTDGGSPLVQSQKIEKGSTVSEPDNLEKQDYIFLFWHLSSDATAYDFKTPVTADITLVAQWTPAVVKAKYTIPNVMVTYDYSGSLLAGMRAHYIIEWPEAPGATEYKLYLETQGKTYLRTTTTNLSVSSYEIFLSTATDTYYYWVTAVVDGVETSRPANGGIKVAYTVSRSTRTCIPGGPPLYQCNYITTGSDSVSRSVSQNPIE